MRYFILLTALLLAGQVEAAEGTPRSGPPPMPEQNISGSISTHNTSAASHSALQPTVTIHTDAAVALTDVTTWETHHYNGDNDVIDFTLPAATAGLVRCFFAGTFAQIITVDVVDGVEAFIIDGVANTAGNAIDTAGTADEKFCVMGKDSTYWEVINGTATIADGGAD